MAKTIGDRISEKRIEKDMTLEALGKLVGVSKVTIHKYENNIITNIPSDRIERLAKALNTTPAYLMGWESNILHKSDVQEINEKLNRFGIDIELVNEDDPDWAVFYNGEFKGTHIVDSIVELYEKSKGKSDEELSREIHNIFGDIDSKNSTSHAVPEVIAAHFDGDMTDEDIDEINQFIEFIKSKK